jgi:hypothetical protein
MMEKSAIGSAPAKRQESEQSVEAIPSLDLGLPSEFVSVQSRFQPDPPSDPPVPSARQHDPGLGRRSHPNLLLARLDQAQACPSGLQTTSKKRFQTHMIGVPLRTSWFVMKSKATCASILSPFSVGVPVERP